jgi:hypothetical protein
MMIGYSNSMRDNRLTTTSKENPLQTSLLDKRFEKEEKKIWQNSGYFMRRASSEG